MAKFFYCAGLLLVAGTLWWAVGRPGWMPRETFRDELVKTGLQALVFGLAGGGVKVLLDWQARRRDFRAEILGRLGRAHKDVYRVRRLLASTPDGAERAKLLGEMMDARQDLCATNHTVGVRGLGSVATQVKDATTLMRTYLEDVIEGALAPDGDQRREKYVAFLDRGRSDYLQGFKKPYELAKRLVDPTFKVTIVGGRKAHQKERT